MWGRPSPLASTGDLRRSPRALSVRPACNLRPTWLQPHVGWVVGSAKGERLQGVRRPAAARPSRGHAARRDGGEFLAWLMSHSAVASRPGSGRDRSRRVLVVDTSAVLEAIVARDAGTRRANSRGWRPPCAASHRHRAASCHLTPNRPRRAERSARFGRVSRLRRARDGSLPARHPGRPNLGTARQPHRLRRRVRGRLPRRSRSRW